MSTFTYRVKDKSGRTQAGTMIGEDEREVAARLQEMGLYVLGSGRFAKGGARSTRWRP